MTKTVEGDEQYIWIKLWPDQKECGTGERCGGSRKHAEVAWHGIAEQCLE